MKILSYGKDGGKDSSVEGWWLIEWKPVFSIALLKFNGKSREAYHTHAFNSISWLLKGKLIEKTHDDDPTTYIYIYTPHINPIITKRDTFHKVDSDGVSWVLTFRGPWKRYWKEYLPSEDRYIGLTHGRKEAVLFHN